MNQKNKERIMATIVRNRKGKQVVLLNPQEKRNKYFAELKSGKKITVDGIVKKDANGKPMKLTKGQAGYRAGFIACQNEQAKIWKRKKNRNAKRK